MQLQEEIRMHLGKLLAPTVPIKLFRGKGCSECNNLGYLGRTGIYEVLQMTDKISRLILERSDATTIEKQAIADGMITVKQDGYLKVLQGKTTIEEVLRVAED